MNPHDAFYLRSMREAYRPLNASEQTALLPLCAQYAHRDQDDLWHAAVGELRADGAAIAVPLTLARLDAYCIAFERSGKSTPYSMAPKKVTA